MNTQKQPIFENEADWLADKPILCERCSEDATIEFKGVCLCPDCYELSFEADCDAQEEARLS